MSNETKVILNKKYALPLIQHGFALIDVAPSTKSPGQVAFIFKNSSELENEFGILRNADRVLKNMYGITLYDIRTLIGALQGYDITDDERYKVMDKLQAIDDMICDVKAPAPEHEDVKEEIDDVVEKLAESTKERLINIENLKDTMSGCK